MSNSFSTRKLGMIFGVLLAIVLIIFVFDDKNERTFRETLVNIDTAKVTEILIYPKSKTGEVKLFKENNKWNVVLNESKSVSVPHDKITNLFNQITIIKPLRLAAKSDKKWKDFQVDDSTGTRVIMKEGSTETLNIMLGKFSFQQPRSMFTYVRLDEDDEVYQVEGFLDMTFNQQPSAFRNAKLVNDNISNWNKLSFEYSDGNSFQMLTAGNNKWQSNGSELDSANVARYLNQLNSITNNNFIDNPTPDVLDNSAMKLSITTNDNRVINLEAFGDTSNYVISSSLNTESYFDGKQNDFVEKIFKTKTDFD